MRNLYLFSSTSFNFIYFTLLILILVNCGHSKDTEINDLFLNPDVTQIKFATTENIILQPNQKKNIDIIITNKYKTDGVIISPYLTFTGSNFIVTYQGKSILNKEITLSEIINEQEIYRFQIEYTGDLDKNTIINLPIKLDAKTDNSKKTFIEEKELLINFKTESVEKNISYVYDAKTYVYNSNIAIEETDEIELSINLRDINNVGVDNKNIFKIENFNEIANNIKFEKINDNSVIYFDAFDENEIKTASLKMKLRFVLINDEEKKDLTLKYTIRNDDYYNKIEGEIQFTINKTISDYNTILKINDTPFSYKENLIDDNTNINVNESLNVHIEIDNLNDIKGDKGVNKLVFTNDDFYQYFDLENNPLKKEEFEFQIVDNKAILNLELRAKQSTLDEIKDLHYKIYNSVGKFRELENKINYKINRIEYQTNIKLKNSEGVEQSEFYVGETFILSLELLNLNNESSNSYFQIENIADLINNDYLVNKTTAIDLSKPQKLNEANLSFRIKNSLTGKKIKIIFYDQKKEDESLKNVVYNAKTVEIEVPIIIGDVTVNGTLEYYKHIRIINYQTKKQGTINFEIIKDVNNQDDLADYKFKIEESKKNNNTLNLDDFIFKSKDNSIIYNDFENTKYNLDNNIATSQNTFSINFFNKENKLGTFEFNLVIYNKANIEYKYSDEILIEEFDFDINKISQNNNIKYQNLQYENVFSCEVNFNKRNLSFTPKFNFSIVLILNNSEIESDLYEYEGKQAGYIYNIQKLTVDEPNNEYIIKVVVKETETGIERFITTTYPVIDYADKIVFSTDIYNNENPKTQVNSITLNKTYNIKTTIIPETTNQILLTNDPEYTIFHSVIEPNNLDISFRESIGTRTYTNYQSFIISDYKNNTNNTVKIQTILYDTKTQSTKKYIREIPINIFKIGSAKINDVYHNNDLRNRLIEINVEKSIISNPSSISIDIEPMNVNNPSEIFFFGKPKEKDNLIYNSSNQETTQIISLNNIDIINQSKFNSAHTYFINYNYKNQNLSISSVNITGNLYFKITIYIDNKVYQTINTNSITLPDSDYKIENNKIKLNNIKLYYTSKLLVTGTCGDQSNPCKVGIVYDSIKIQGNIEQFESIKIKLRQREITTLHKGENNIIVNIGSILNQNSQISEMSIITFISDYNQQNHEAIKNNYTILPDTEYSLNDFQLFYSNDYN